MNEIKRPGRNATKTEREKYGQMLKTETIEQRYVRVSKPIVAKTLKLLNRLAKMQSSPNYHVTFEQNNALVETLHKKVDVIKSAFEPKKQEVIDTDLTAIYGE